MDIEKQYPSLKKMGHIRFKEKRKSYLGRYKGTVSAILQMKQFSVGLFCNAISTTLYSCKLNFLMQQRSRLVTASAVPWPFYETRKSCLEKVLFQAFFNFCKGQLHLCRSPE